MALPGLLTAGEWMLGTAAATDMPMLAQNVRRQPEYIYSCMPCSAQHI